MITLLPQTASQDFNIVPRKPNELDSLTLTIREDGTGTSETFNNVTAFENGDYICISQAFTFLKENYLYYITITQDGENWWRGKARCTSQTDRKIKHTLYTGSDEGFPIVTNSETFPIINS